MKYQSLLHHFTQKIPFNCYCCGQTSYTGLNMCSQCQQYLLNWPIYAYHCYQCGRKLQEQNQYLRCGQCIKKPPYIDQLVFINDYEGLLRQLITQFKFHKKHFLQSLLADLLSQRVVDEQLPSALIPVPLHPKKYIQRGFNQAEVISQYISNQFNIPYLNGVCQRIKNTHSQSELKGNERYLNVKNAFQVNHSINYPTIAIIDDVVTTGYTVNALSRVIKQQTQVQSISVWCLARGQFN